MRQVPLSHSTGGSEGAAWISGVVRLATPVAPPSRDADSRDAQWVERRPGRGNVSFGPLGSCRFKEAGRRYLSLAVVLLSLACGSALAQSPDPLALFSAPVPNGTEVTIATGRLFLYGNDLGTPTRLAFRDSTVLANGYQIYPELPLRVAEPKTQPVVSPKILEQIALHQQQRKLQRQLEQAGTSPAEVRAAVVAFLRASPIVKSVTNVTETCAWVNYSDGSGMEISIQSPTPPSTRAKQSEQARIGFIELQQILKTGCYHFIGETVGFTIPPNNDNFEAVQNEIVLATASGSLEALQAGWNGRHLPLEIAKELYSPRPIAQLKRGK